MKFFMTIVLATALAACGGKKDQEPAAKAAQETPPTTPTTAAAPSDAQAGSAAEPAAVDDLPTEADFEEDATAKITKDTVEAELTKLENQLQ